MITLSLAPTFAASNTPITYQARILKPDGSSLEGMVSFQFIVRSPTDCVLWSENRMIDMTGSKGAVSAEIGMGTNTSGTHGFASVFKNSGTLPNLAGCTSGTDYIPNSDDDRTLTVVFDDGTGPQTAPIVTIKTVPFAREAVSTMALRGIEISPVAPTNGQVLSYNSVLDQWVPGNSSVAAVTYVDVSLPGSLFSASSGGVSTTGTISFSLGTQSQNFVFAGPATGGTGTPAFRALVDADIPSLDASKIGSGTLATSVLGVVPGANGGTVVQVDTGAGLEGGPINVAGTISLGTTGVASGSYGSASQIATFTVDQYGRLTSTATVAVAIDASQVTSGTLDANLIPDLDAAKLVSGTLATARLGVSGVTAGSYGSGTHVPTFNVDQYGRLTSAGSTAITSSQWSNIALGINYGSGGSVGIGVATPVVKLDVAGAIKIANDSAVCGPSFAGAIRYSGGLLQYCDGSTPGWVSLGVSGSGLQALNGLIASSQDFAVGSSGTVAAFTSSGSLHTLNIPMASTTDAVGGLLSHAEYLTLMNGTIPAARVADLDASQITSGTLALARLGTLGVAQGATGLTPTIADINKIYGVDSDGSGAEFKEVTGGTGITVNHSAGTITISTNGMGSVTEVIAGAGLTGGTITSAGTIALPTLITAGTVGSATYIPQIGFDAFGRIVSAGSFAVSLSSLDGTLGVSQGGTGLDGSSAANGALLIGNGSGFTLGTLTYSNGMVVTNSAGTINLATNAQTANVNNTIITRDGSGNFVAGAADLAGVSLRGSVTGTATLTAPSSFTNYAMTLPTDMGTPGQVLRTNGTSQLSWVSAPVDGGTILAASGSAGTPGIAFSADPDTGLWNPGSNTLSISTGGTTRVTIGSVGFVGIGTESPTSRLHVNGNLTADNLFMPGSSGWVGTSTSGLVFYNGWIQIDGDIESSAGNENFFLRRAGASAAQPSYSFSNDQDTGMFRGAADTLEFSTAATSRLMINSTGSVGIGTSTPQALLDVNGAIRIANDSATCAAPNAGALRYNGGTLEYCNGVGPAWLALGVSGSGLQSLNGLVANNQLFAVDSLGTVAAITSSGSLHTLSIPLASTADAVAGLISHAEYLSLMNGTIPTARGGSQWSDNARGINYSSGSVGIGTNSPANKLHVQGGTGSSPTLELTRTDNGTSSEVLMNHTSGVGNSQPYWSASSGSGNYAYNISTWNGTTAVNRLTILPDGNVGIGVSTPAAQLTVGGLQNQTQLRVQAAPVQSFNIIGVYNSGGTLVSGITSGGRFAAPSGDQTAPGFHFGPDAAGNGIFRPAADMMGFATSSNERMRITATGEIGMGTTSVGAGNLLEVTGGAIAAGNGGELRMMETLANGTNSVSFRAPSALAQNYAMTLPGTIGTPGQVLTTDGTGNLSWVTSTAATNIDGLSDGNTTSGTGVLFLGSGAGSSNTGAYNVGVGLNALAANTSGQYNVAIGVHAGWGNGITGALNNNTLVGAGAGDEMIGGARDNVALGIDALGSVTTGSTNTAIGSRAGSTTTTGIRNIMIGADALAPSGTASHRLNIGNTIYGDLFAGNIGIGTSTPNRPLHVAGSTMNELIQVQNDMANASSSMRFVGYDAGSNWREGYFGFDPIAGSNQSRFTIGNGTTDLFMVRMDGRVALGTMDVGAGNLLEVTGGAIAAGNGGELRMMEEVTNGTNSIGLRAPTALAANYTMTLPGTIGTPGQVLTTDGTGNLSWVSAGAGVTFPLLSTTRGSVSTPAYSFSGDSDTGLYSPGADTLAISTNGTTRITIDHSGNVAVGIGTPATSMHLYGAGPGGEQILRVQNADTQAARIESVSDVGSISLNALGSSDGNSTFIHSTQDMRLTTSNSSNIIFAPNWNETARFQANGAVGIGTAAIGLGNQLEVTGGAIAAGNGGELRMMEEVTNGTNSIGLRAPTTLAANYSMILPGTIGTPGQALITDGTGNLSWGVPTGVSQWVDVASGIHYSSGSVGIGTATPDGKFSVDAGLYNLFTVGSNGVDAMATNYTFYANGNNTLLFQFGFNQNTEIQGYNDGQFPVLLQKNGGNVGIGHTNPNHRLDVRAASGVTSGTFKTSFSQVDVNPGTLSTASFLGGQSYAFYNGSVSSPGASVFGHQGLVQNPGGRTVGSMTGIEGLSENTAGGRILHATGVSGVVRNTSTGSIGAATALYASVEQAAGVVGSAYGLYIDQVQATDNGWGIYQESPLNTNFLAGKTSIGAAEPGLGNMFEVLGGAIAVADQGQLKMMEGSGGGTNWVSFRAPAAMSQNYVMTLPETIGSAGQVLATDGTGSLSWVTAGGGSPTFPLLSTTLGSAATAAYSFLSDTNTGIYSPGADQLAVSTNGTTRIHFLANGKIGVGTSTPDHKFTVRKEISDIESYEATAAVQTVVDSAANDPDHVLGLTSHLNIRGSYDNTGSIKRALQGEAYIEGAGNKGTVTGAAGVATIAGNAQGHAVGVLAESSRFSSADNSVTALLAGALNYSGTAQVFGLVGGQLNATNNIGRTVEGFGVRSIYNNSGGTTSYATGVYTEVELDGGVIGIAKGIEIGTIQGTEKWSLVATDASAPSRLAGSLALGTNTLLQQLNVGGGIALIGGGTASLLPPASGAPSLRLPSSVGTSGQVLMTDGTGNLSWTTASSGVTFPLLSTTLGSAGAAAYSFSGDTDTGIYSPGPNELAFTTNGSARIQIGSTGAVGISSAPNPNTVLFVNPAAPNTTNDYSIVTATTNFSPSTAYGGTASAMTADLLWYGTQNSPSAFANGFAGGVWNWTNRSLGIANGMYSYAGSSGEGVVSEAAGIRTEAATGGVQARITSAYGGMFTTLANGGTISNAYGVYADNSVVQGVINNSYGVYIDDVDGNSQWGLYQVGANDRNYLAGSLGIGTTSPARSLHVNGAVRITPAALPTGSAGDISFDSTFNNFLTWHDGTTWQYTPKSSMWDNRVYSTAAAGANGLPNVARNEIMNTAPVDGSAYVNGMIVRNAANDYQAAYIGVSSNNAGFTPNIIFGQKVTSGDYQERMRIDAAGSIGIGTTTPLALLDVAGISRSTSQVIAGSGTVTILPPLGGTTAIRFPATAGSAGQVLSTNGAGGSLGWVSVPSNGGTFLAASGSAGAPGFAFSSDTDTGLWNPGANTLAISTLGTTRMTINSLGNVGVGTDAPGSILDVVSSGQPVLTVRSTAASANSALYLIGRNSGVDNTGMLYAGQGGELVMRPASGAYINLQDGASNTRINIANSGNVNINGITVTPSGSLGIGTSSPFDQFVLKNPNNGGSAMTITTGGTMNAQQSSLTMMTQDNGSVIGSPGNKGWQMVARGDAWANTSQRNDFLFSYYDGSGWRDPFVIDSITGNISMGTVAAAPGARLDIAGTGTLSSSIILPRDTAANRPAAPVNGMIRYNSTANAFEGYQGGNWVHLTGVVTTDGDSLSALSVDFANSRTIEATASTAACGALTLTGLVAGGSYTLAINNANTTCSSIVASGYTVKLPSGYSAGASITGGIVYTFLPIGSNLWVSAVPF